MTELNAHALVIGVGTFKHASNNNVPVTIRDAKAIETVLKDPDYCGYPKKNVTFLSEGKATKDGIADALKTLAKQTDETSIVFLFLCSHGAYDTNDDWSFMTHDAKVTAVKGEARIVADSSLGREELLGLIRNVKASKLFIIFNTCHSGNASTSLSIQTQDEESLQSKTPDLQFRSALLFEGAGTVIITASGKDQLSKFSKNADLTYFTDIFVQGLKGPKSFSTNEDGEAYISVFDLYEYLYEGLVTTTLDQEPELNILQGRGPLPIALYQGNKGSLSLDFSSTAPIPTKGSKVITKEEAEQAYQSITINNTLGERANQISGDNNVVNQQQTTVDQSNNSGFVFGNNASIGGDVFQGSKVDNSNKFNIGSIQGGAGGVTAVSGDVDLKQQLLTQLEGELAKLPDETSKTIKKWLTRFIDAASEAAPDADDVELYGDKLLKEAKDSGNTAVSSLAKKVVVLYS